MGYRRNETEADPFVRKVAWIIGMSLAMGSTFALIVIVGRALVGAGA